MGTFILQWGQHPANLNTTNVAFGAIMGIVRKILRPSGPLQSPFVLKEDLYEISGDRPI